MFSYEEEQFLGAPSLDLTAQNITVPGFSPLYPDAHCNPNGTVCQMTTGEAEINAGCSVTALLRSGLFNLTQTYFLIAGIAGVNPEVATLGSVALNRFSVQVGLEYEFDVRELGANWTTGYVPFGSVVPDQYPSTIYGTEVFELNVNLRDKALSLAQSAVLNDSSDAVAYRAMYNASDTTAANGPPSVVACDGATSDVYYSGNILSGAFDNLTTLLTNGTGKYCTTAQEDNATLEAMVRATVDGLVDFARIICMRSASDFDRPPPGISAAYHLFYAAQGGFEPALLNLYLCGQPIIDDILMYWNSTYEPGLKPGNYIGDILGTLGGTPDFGYIPPS